MDCGFRLVLIDLLIWNIGLGLHKLDCGVASRQNRNNNVSFSITNHIWIISSVIYLKLNMFKMFILQERERLFHMFFLTNSVLETPKLPERMTTQETWPFFSNLLYIELKELILNHKYILKNLLKLKIFTTSRYSRIQ